MKYILAVVIEGLVAGLLMALVVVLWRIDVSTAEIVILGISAGFITSLASGTREQIMKGGKYHEWLMQYNEHAISVQIGKAGELYVNGKLLDRNTSVWSKEVELKGLLDSGEKLTAKIRAASASEMAKSGKTFCCELLVDGKAMNVVPT